MPVSLDDDEAISTINHADTPSAAPAADQPAQAVPARRRRAARRPAGRPEPAESTTEPAESTAGHSATPAVGGPAVDEAAVDEAAVDEAAVDEAAVDEADVAPAVRTPRKRASRARKVAAPKPAATGGLPQEVVAAAAVEQPSDQDVPADSGADLVAAEPVAAPEPAAPRRRRSRKTAAEVIAHWPGGQAPDAVPATAVPATAVPVTAVPVEDEAEDEAEDEDVAVGVPGLPSALAMPLFQAPEVTAAAPRRSRRAASRPAGPPLLSSADVEDAIHPEEAAEPAASHRVTEVAEGEVLEAVDDLTDDADDAAGDFEDDEEGAEPGRRRRRRRGGRGRRGRSRGAEDAGSDDAGSQDADAEGDDEVTPDESDDESDDEAEGVDDAADEAGETTAGSRRRRRRRRRASGSADAAEPSPDDPPNTVVKVREARRSGGGGDDVAGLRGSTRLEAKKQRRREGREAGRRRPVITEAEFLARRESVERVMVVREREGRTQIGVLEDGVLVEHYVARRTQTSMVGNVYLGKVQNVLPSMEAAFVDIGKGRNAVLYAGEVNWDAAGLEGQPKRIEHALKSGESVLVQVTKDPIGHKGARLTSQISLPGRYLVYVPDGSMTGISRKLPDTERNRLKKILRAVVPDDAGVIVRTAAEGASEEELERDVARLSAQWEDIARKAGAVNAPALLYGEPDLAIRVVRDIFNEDFSRLVVIGDDTWDTLQAYIGHVAPDLVSRLERWDGDGDAFASFRIDEQLAKALDRKVWLPSGGSLVIDRTEAMTVVDVNTGKFTGAGGNLEETVTKNNVEAAEEIVRQLRLRDIGGIIVVDFIDMVLESNRELVMRRLLECLGRDRTKHQVAEVTSLGLVQMTRKRVGQGLLEVFSETCEHCGGRGIILHDEPVEKRQQQAPEPRSGRGSGSGESGSGSGSGGSGSGSGGSGSGSGSGGSGSGSGSGRRSRGRGGSEGSSAGGGEAASAASSAASA
jgi:ribonuclease E